MTHISEQLRLHGLVVSYLRKWPKYGNTLSNVVSHNEPPHRNEPKVVEITFTENNYLPLITPNTFPEIMETRPFFPL